MAHLLHSICVGPRVPTPKIYVISSYFSHAVSCANRIEAALGCLGIPRETFEITPHAIVAFSVYRIIGLTNLHFFLDHSLNERLSSFSAIESSNWEALNRFLTHAKVNGIPKVSVS